MMMRHPFQRHLCINNKMLYWIYCQLFWCKRKLCPETRKEKTEIKSSNFPWFWIGAQFEDRTEPVTNIVNTYAISGCLVNSDFLRSVTGYKPLAWKYMDAITLEEKEVPSEGILIEDA